MRPIFGPLWPPSGWSPADFDSPCKGTFFNCDIFFDIFWKMNRRAPVFGALALFSGSFAASSTLLGASALFCVNLAAISCILAAFSGLNFRSAGRSGQFWAILGNFGQMWANGGQMQRVVYSSAYSSVAPPPMPYKSYIERFAVISPFVWCKLHVPACNSCGEISGWVFAHRTPFGAYNT